MDTFQAKKQKLNHGKDCVSISLDLSIPSNIKVKNLYYVGV
jgi:hypothetical protein